MVMLDDINNYLIIQIRFNEDSDNYNNVSKAAKSNIVLESSFPFAITDEDKKGGITISWSMISIVIKIILIKFDDDSDDDNDTNI